MNKKLILSIFVLAGAPMLLSATGEARLLRFPATNGNEIVFSYAGDLYKVPASGGEAQRSGRQNDCIHRAVRWKYRSVYHACNGWRTTTDNLHGYQ